MALIRCPECGEKVSDQAKVCIHCGYPLNEKINANDKKMKELRKKAEKLCEKNELRKKMIWYF